MEIKLVREIKVPTEVGAILMTGRPQLAKILNRRLTIKEQEQVVDALIVYMQTLELACIQVAELKTIIGTMNEPLSVLRQDSAEITLMVQRMKQELNSSVTNYHMRIRDERDKLSGSESE